MRPEYYRNKTAEFELKLSPLNEPVEEKSTLQKRTPIFDKLFASFILVFTSPVLAAIWMLLSLGGQRPIFLQERVGLGGNLFQIFKFRTIPDDGWDKAEHAADASQIAALRLGLFKRVSRILRSTGLDELPQFANILNGDMRIIGPRPLVLEDFRALPEGRMERCAVPPGITGFAQINGGQELDAASKLALDIYVIDHLSFGMTVRIISRTIVRIVRGAAATAQANASDLDRARQYWAFRHHNLSGIAMSTLDSAKVGPTTPRRSVIHGATHLKLVPVGASIGPHRTR